MKLRTLLSWVFAGNLLAACSPATFRSAGVTPSSKSLSSSGSNTQTTAPSDVTDSINQPNSSADTSIGTVKSPGSGSSAGSVHQPSLGDSTPAMVSQPDPSQPVPAALSQLPGVNDSSGQLPSPTRPSTPEPTMNNPSSGSVAQATCLGLAVKNIAGGWVIPPMDSNGKPVFVQVVNKKLAQLTQFYNVKGYFGMPIGSTIQASSQVSVGDKVQVKVSNNYNFSTFQIVDPCTMTLVLESPARQSSDTFCDSFETTWNGSLQQQAIQASPSITPEIADLQQCSNLATAHYNLSPNKVDTELFRDLGGLTRIGFDTNHQVGGSVSEEVARTLASDIKECAAAINLKYKDSLVGFKPCQCGHLGGQLPADLPAQ